MVDRPLDNPRHADVQLARRIVRGDSAALDALYDDYAEPLFRFVFHRAGGDHSEAEEIVQETFLSALSGMRRYRGDAALFSWLCGIAKNHLRGQQRRQSRERAYRDRVASALDTVDAELDAALARLEEAPLPYAVIEREETRELVGSVMSSLPVDYQSVLVDKYYEQQSVADIASRHGTSPKAIESRLTRARTAFRTAWKIVSGQLLGDGGRT